MAENSGKKLAYSVTLWDSATYQYKTFYPGEVLPTWAEGMVRNPKAFVADGAESHPAGLVPGVDVPIAGPSQLAHDADPRFADQPRYTHAGNAVSKGHDIADEPVTVLFAGPPQLHDHVAAKASEAEFTTAGKEQTYKVRTGLVQTEGERLAEEARARDESDAMRAEAIFTNAQRAAMQAQEDDSRQQAAAAMAMQMQVHSQLEAVNRTNFEAGVQEQVNADSQRESGAGFVANPVIQGTGAAPVPGVEIRGELGIDPAIAEETDTSAADVGPEAEAVKSAEEPPKDDAPAKSKKSKRDESKD